MEKIDIIIDVIVILFGIIVIISKNYLVGFALLIAGVITLIWNYYKNIINNR